MSIYAILDGTLVLPCDDVLKWAEWFEESDEKRVIAKTYYQGGIEISTVFMGINHAFGDQPPQWFETMVFGGEYDQYTTRCESWNQALMNHSNACFMLEKEGVVMAHLANDDLGKKPEDKTTLAIKKILSFLEEREIMKEKPVFSIVEERVEYDVEETLSALKETIAMLEVFKSRRGEGRVVFSIALEIYPVQKTPPNVRPTGQDGA